VVECKVNPVAAADLAGGHRVAGLGPQWDRRLGG
jgi:hypothetical protein